MRLSACLVLLASLLLAACEVPSQECPLNASWADTTCACDSGMYGEITWNAEFELYDGECITPVEMAVRTGDPSYVDAAAPLLNEALAALDAASGTWTGVLSDIYGSDPVFFVPTIWSQHVNANSLESNTTLVLGSESRLSLAAIGQRGSARYAAFGVDLLSGFVDGNHAEFAGPFARTLSWMFDGEAGGLPDSASVGIVGMGDWGQNNAMTWVSEQGWDSAVCTPDAYATCLVDQDLLIVGAAGGDANVSAFAAAYEAALDAGVPVLFQHTETWATSAFGDAALAPLDLSYGGYGGNYWDNDFADWNGVDDMLDDGGSIASLRTLVTNLQAGDWDFDWSGCTEFVGQWSCGDVEGFRAEFLDGAQAVKAALNGLDARGVGLFREEGRRTWKLLALLGDVYRRDIAYPMDKDSTDQATFLAAYYADHSVHYSRDIQPLQEDMGTFSDGDERDVDPLGPQTVDVAVSKHGGFNAVGLYALPGQVLTVERTDGEELSAWVSVNTQRTGSTREFDGDGYTRPKFLKSPTIPLVSGAPVTFASPYGGTLQLHVPGSSEDRTLTLVIDGAAQHEVLDLGEDTTAYAAALADSPFPFTEIRNPYVQVHSKVSMMLDSIDAYDGDLDLFFADLERYMIQDTYNLAGFVGEGLEQSQAVLDFCSDAGWDCTDPDIHGKPAVQHINVDTYAHCGGGCSGNPYDQAWALGPLGWGETHEIGHNLQTGRIRIYGGRSNEVSNQIFPLHKHATWAADTGESLSGDRSDYEYIFEALQASTTTGDPVQTVYELIWEADGTYSNNGDRMNFYLQVAHRSDDVTWLDSGWDVYTLMYLQDRLTGRAMRDEDAWDAAKEALGFGEYTDIPDMDGNDFMLLSMSWITERDQRPFFAMFGITWSADADAQLEAYGLEPEPATFWASTDCNQPPHPDPVLIDGVSVWPL